MKWKSEPFSALALSKLALANSGWNNLDISLEFSLTGPVENQVAGPRSLRRRWERIQSRREFEVKNCVRLV